MNFTHPIYWRAKKRQQIKMSNKNNSSDQKIEMTRAVINTFCAQKRERKFQTGTILSG